MFEELALRARAGEVGVKAYRDAAGYSEPLAKSEIAANYAMRTLFTDEKTIREVTKHHSKLAEVIRGILQWIKEKIGKSNEIDRAIYLWNKAYNQASRNAENSDVHNAVAKENTAEGGVKFSTTMGDAQADAVIGSFNIDSDKLGDYIHVQKRVLQTLIKEDFFTNKDNRSRIEVNTESGMIVEINKSGIDETFNSDNYGKRAKQLKLFKLATIRLIPDVIKNGHLISRENANIHGAQYTTKYAYIEDVVNVNGKEISVKISIKQSAQKNKFWVHNVYLNEKVTGQGAGTSKSSKTPYKTDDSIKNIAQDSAVVKENGTKNSTSATDELVKPWRRSQNRRDVRL